MKPRRLKRCWAPRMPRIALAVLITWAPLIALAPSATAGDQLEEQIAPFAKKYCIACHNHKKSRGDLDLTRYVRDRDVTADFRRWTSIAEFIRDGEMPPIDELQRSDRRMDCRPC